MKYFTPLLLSWLVLQLVSTAEDSNSAHLLWYEHSGQSAINEGLPVGNGRIGALINGAANIERIPFCEDSVWSGWVNPNGNNPEALKQLETIRRQFLEGAYASAEQKVRETQICRDVTGEGDPMWDAYGTYQMLAFVDLIFDVDPQAVTNYRRQLDMRTGVISVSYSVGNVDYLREFYCSQVDQVLVAKFSASAAGALHLTAKLTRPDTKAQIEKISKNTLKLSGKMDTPKSIEPLRYELLMQAVPQGGTPRKHANALAWEGADEVTIYFAASTNYRGLNAYPNFVAEAMKHDTQSQINTAIRKGESQVRKDHIEDFSKLYNRTELELPQGDPMPTDLRLKQVNNGQSDPVLDALMYHYARYLLIASSREGSLPANLQGLWTTAQKNVETNKFEYWTPWNGGYHTNINVQMNYWPALGGHLETCVRPFHELIRSASKPGKATARIQHGCGGWTVHTIHNIWGHTAPGSEASWGHFPMAGPWLTRHLWEHYLYTLDIDTLSKNWETLRGSARFVCDWMVEDPSSGKLVSVPAASPENSFYYPDGSSGFFCVAPTMDQMIAREVLEHTLLAANVLNREDETTEHFRKVLSAIKDYEIAEDGRVMEWGKPYEEAEKGHRHISHLYDLFPGDEAFNPKRDGFAEAAKKTLAARLEHGGGHTGWSSAWITNFWARLGKAREAYDQLLVIQRKSTLPNLFNSHPPFQIDGNFGLASGINEMIIQSFYDVERNETVLRLLPALPKDWSDGAMKGVMVRGALEAALEWESGRIKTLTLKSTYPADLRFEVDGNIYEHHFDGQSEKTWSF